MIWLLILWPGKDRTENRNDVIHNVACNLKSSTFKIKIAGEAYGS